MTLFKAQKRDILKATFVYKKIKLINNTTIAKAVYIIIIKN